MDVMQISIQNPDATIPLIIPVVVLPNTLEEEVNRNIRHNSRMDVPWLYASEPHDRVAVLCGGGPSLADSREAIAALKGDIFGLNGAARWLWENGLWADYQIIIDAQQITAGCVEPRAAHHLFASHVHPDTAASADEFFHLNFEGIEDLFPPEKVAAGGYTLVGGGVSVGITALVVAYTLGYRKLHLFGYDSCNREGATHAYSQPHNAAIPNIDVTWAGKTYNASMPMKLQAEAFIRFADQLQEEGCEITVHGDGLLPAMWREPPASEREKYQYLWAGGDYRRTSFGEHVFETFDRLITEPGKLIDFGCGTGRAALRLADLGYDVTCIDFTDNCRDKEALRLPFLQWDLTQPIPIKGDVGFCTDVMEHIPPEDVDAVIANILDSTPRAFFQIATVPDSYGATIGQTLHLTVRDHDWWRAKFPAVLWEERTPMHSIFYVSKGE